MPKSWSFPTSPRNPAKIVVELSILAKLADQWKEREEKWKPETTQIEFGEALRASGEIEGAVNTEQNLTFRKQTDTITPQNLAWTARARFGTFKFLGLVYVKDGYVELTEAGDRIIITKRPDIIMLKQLIKWQYPDNQHKGRAYPEQVFNIWPFVAVSQLIKDLGGLTKHELALFCFNMTTMKDLAKTRKAIADFRVLYAQEKGRIPKRKLITNTRRSLKQQSQERGDNLPIDAFTDYADALGRYMRYTGLFSIDGNRIVLTKGRREEIEDVLKIELDLRPYDNSITFYNYYGNPDLPVLPSDVNPIILQNQIKDLIIDYQGLYDRFCVLKYGDQRDYPINVPQTLPIDIEELRTLLYDLREEKKKLEFEINDIDGRGPAKLEEALNFYENIVGRRTFDDATYLEWNTWRVFVALNHAKRVKPNLVLDENLDPVNTAPGGGADIEVSFEDFHIVLEVTMRRGTDQAYYETFPVIRHVEDFMLKFDNQETYGLFIAPRCHDDTYHQFFISWKYGGSKGNFVKIVPLTIGQFKDITKHYIQDREFHPSDFRKIFEDIGIALQKSRAANEWKNLIQVTIDDWIQHNITKSNP